jgi:hypothetical protein
MFHYIKSGFAYKTNLGLCNDGALLVNSTDVAESIDRVRWSFSVV